MIALFYIICRALHFTFPLPGSTSAKNQKARTKLFFFVTLPLCKRISVKKKLKKDSNTEDRHGHTANAHIDHIYRIHTERHTLHLVSFVVSNKALFMRYDVHLTQLLFVHTDSTCGDVLACASVDMRRYWRCING